MTTDADIKWFIQSLKKPFDMRGSLWKPEENVRIEQYQNLARAFFLDLKNSSVITLYDVLYPPFAPFDHNKIIKLVKINIGIMEKLPKINEFTGDEQFFILCNNYLFWVEQVKSILLPFVERIYNTIPKTEREKKKIVKPNFRSTLRLVMTVLINYRNGKYSDLFSDIDVDLRNAIAHPNIDFGETKIMYDNKSISGLDLITLIRKMALLFTILYNISTLVFTEETIQELRKRGYTI